MEELSKWDKIKRRKNFIVNLKCQAYIILYFLALGVMCSTLIYNMAMTLIENLNGAVSGSVPSDVIGQYTENFIYKSFAIVLLLFGGSVLGGIFVTHRIVGPIFKLNNSLKQMTEKGELEPVKFRADDFFKETEENFNELVESINKKKAS